MAQIFDGGKYWRIRVGKILTSKKSMNANVFIKLSFWSSYLLLAHATLIVSHTYLQLYVARKSYAHAFAHMYIVANWHKHKSATPFWVAAGYVRVYMVKATWYHTTASVSLSHVPVWWYIHSQLFRGYHYSLTIDSVRAPLTDVQGLIASVQY